MSFGNDFLFKPSGTGSGSSVDDGNLISDPTFAQGNVNQWVLGTATLTSNLPTGAPTFGSGASGNLSIAATSSSPLRGSYSMSYVSSAATTAGNFVSTVALTVPLEYQARVLQFKFYYSPTSNPTNGNFSGTTSNSFGVAFYDVTNSAWVIPAGVFNIVQNSGVGVCTGTIQTASNVTSLRMVIYNANATSGAITMYFDDFYLGPQIVPQGAAMTDWTSYTPTIGTGFGTTSNLSARWRRSGDKLDAIVSFTAGTVSANPATITLPSGLSIDSAKLPINNTSGNPGNHVGYYENSEALANTHGSIVTAPSTSTTLVYFARSTVDAASGLTPANGNNVTASSVVVSCVFSVPISGWSSNTVLSNDTDTRIVDFYGTQSSEALTANTTNATFTVVRDTHAAWATNIYTVPVAGDYVVGCVGVTSSASGSLVVYKNGSAFKTVTGIQSSRFGSGIVTLPACVPGDTISLRCDASVTVTSGSFSIFRLSGPATVAASESVNCRYFASATSISGSLATVVWTTKDYDSHNAMSSGVYTVPITGKYYVGAAVAFSGTFVLNNTSVIEIQKNSTAVSNLTRYIAAAITNDGIDIEDVISCNAGDTIRIQVSNSGTTPAIVSSNTKNFISIHRVGN